ncbi:MAG TPA: hypothetical protein VF877_12810, partial [Gaiellaceae bacterium]
LGAEGGKHLQRTVVGRGLDEDWPLRGEQFRQELEALKRAVREYDLRRSTPCRSASHSRRGA